MNDSHAFLLRAAELLHSHGTPSFRLEGVMTKVAASLGVRAVFLYTPTALIVSLGDEKHEQTYLRRVTSGDVDINRLLSFDKTLGELEAGTISIAEATNQMEAAAAESAPFSLFVSLLAAAIACGGVAVAFGGSLADTIVAALFGGMIALASSFFQGPRFQRGWLEPVLGFLAALAAVIISQWLPINDRLVTLAALILPIPGLTLTIALTELATGHLSSGSARLAGAVVTLFTLTVGVAIAWRLTDGWIANLAQGEPLPWWCLWIAMAITPAAFAVVFKAPFSQWPVIAVVTVAGFVASRWGSHTIAPEVGAFLGALVVGCLSNGYARIWNRPAMVPQTPGLLILVPGSIGFRSLAAMVQSDTVKGIELAFSMSIVGVALVGGLLLASQIISPKRIL